MARLQILIPSALSFVTAVAIAQASAEARLTLDMPHGGCRLTVLASGAGRLAYGALPAWIDVRPGTFEPGGVLSLFRSLAKPESDRSAMKPPVGSLTFHPQEEKQWFDAAVPAQALFRRALENRSPTQVSNLYPEAEAIIVKACSAV